MPAFTTKLRTSKLTTIEPNNQTPPAEINGEIQNKQKTNKHAADEESLSTFPEIIRKKTICRLNARKSLPQTAIALLTDITSSKEKKLYVGKILK